MQEFIVAHWPFCIMAAVFWIVGHFMETSVFTRARAYEPSKAQWFWWWGRESMELHPILAGVALGLVWTDPEFAGWSFPTAVGYFAGAGVVSLFGWLIVRKVMERFGVGGGFRLPGESLPPDGDKK